jgi:glycosyltransferase involved in cell wall biosynthesis
MHILHQIAGLSKAGGGTSTYVADLASTQARLDGAAATIVTIGAAQERVPVDAAVDVQTLATPVRAGALNTVVNDLQAQRPLDICHGHGLWLPFGHQFQRAARRRNIPFVLSPHGMLEPGALQFSKWKKRVALALFQRRDLDQADLLHATAIEEADNFRAFGLKQPIMISPPGVHLPSLRPVDQPVPKSQPSGKRIALFLSRVHPKKNLPVLLKVWARLQLKDWRLVIAGPDEGGHADDLQQLAADLGLSSQVEFAGPVWGAAKEALYRQASLFVLPSLSENFGIVVPEALSYEIPVLTTTATPWSELEARDCGWCIAPTEAAIAGALEEACSRSVESLSAMGGRGRLLVTEKYQWQSIATEMQSGYAWLLGQGDKPQSILEV